MGDRGEDVLAYLLVVQIGVTALQRTQCPNPGVGVDVLDLVIRERTTEARRTIARAGRRSSSYRRADRSRHANDPPMGPRPSGQ